MKVVFNRRAYTNDKLISNTDSVIIKELESHSDPNRHYWIQKSQHVYLLYIILDLNTLRGESF